MEIVVKVNPKVFSKGISAAKSFKGKFNASDKTWTLNEQLVIAAKGTDKANTIKEWLGYRGLMLVDDVEMVQCWECGGRHPRSGCTHDGSGWICATCAQ